MTFNPEAPGTWEDMLDWVIKEDEIMVLRRKGEPVAVMVRYDSWREMQDDLDRHTAMPTLDESIDGQTRKR